MKSCSGSDLKSDNLRRRVLFMCLLVALPGSLDGGDSRCSELTQPLGSFTRRDEPNRRPPCQVSLDTQGHFNFTVATLAFFCRLRKSSVCFSGSAMWPDFVNTDRNGG